MFEKKVCLNGLTIIGEKMPHFRSVSLGIWIGAGSMDEQPEEAGMAHFIEHMLFKGTTTRTAQMIAEQFDQIGGDINAFTSKETTCYFVTVLREHAEQAMTIMADMLLNSTFTDEEMVKEKSVIVEEIATVADTPDDEVHERLWEVMFPNHPIGKPILGNEQTLMTFDRSMVDNFIERTYHPSNLVISVAGNYDEQFVRKIERLFASLPTYEGIQPTMPEQATFTTTEISKNKDIEQTHICLGFPGLPTSDERIFDLAVLDSIVGGAMSSRLFQYVREERGLAYSVYSYYTSYEQTGAFICYAGTAPEKATELHEAMLAIIQSVIEDGVTEQEVLNAQEQIVGSFILGLETPESRMARNGRNEVLREKFETIEEIVDKVRATTKQSVNRLAKELLQHEPAVSIIAPEVDEEGN